MGDWAVVRQLLDFIPTINFGNTTSEVSLFETTIRYLGGLLSAYDIMTGPLRDEFAGHERQVEVVLEQAHFLAEQLKEAFNTPSGVPDNMLLFNPVRKKGARTNGLAVTGTLVLEWTRLSDLTGNPLYGRLAQKAESYLLDPQPASGEPWPGLLGSHINITNGRFVSTGGSWGGGDDSFYEYLIKMYLYDPVRFGRYKDRWVAAAESTIKYLTSHPTTRPDLTYVAAWKDDKSLTYASGHCEFPPSLSLSAHRLTSGATTPISGLLQRGQLYPGRADAGRAAVRAVRARPGGGLLQHVRVDGDRDRARGVPVAGQPGGGQRDQQPGPAGAAQGLLPGVGLLDQQRRLRAAARGD